MTRLLSALWLVSNLAAGAAGTLRAQRHGRDHGSLASQSVDVEANKKIFVGMGGTYIKRACSTSCGFPASS
jgi:hypothetical protein